ncbi:MAG TPA: outer membrane lipoprotein carrier protein LolA [Pyrinomonadaceae bacterium]|nr:outer membrane lipoprotein carrier protein LolA [Pyrinomonadaceae bacterium]
MKRFVPLVLLSALIFCAAVLAAPKSAKAQGAGLVSSVLSRLEKNRASLKSLKAGITIEKYNSQIGTNDKSEGVVIYLPGSGRQASLRIDWTRPSTETLAVSKGRYQLYRPKWNTVIVGLQNKAPQTSGLIDMMYMSRQQLETRFQPLQDVREETLGGEVSTIHLTLIPKGNAGYKYAEIWIDSAGMPVQTKIVEKNDDSTTMRLTKLQKNVPVSSGEFELKLDSNVKVVKS